MLLIEEVMVSQDVVDEQFLCNLNACKGACCWEGDFGAPLETEELHILENIIETIKAYMTEEGIAVVEKEGVFTYFEDMKDFGTPLINNKACVYLNYNELGIAQCGIEQAWRDGKIEWRKPISCHLYPVRVSRHKKTNTLSLNYDRWDICNAACTAGRKAQLPVYKFAKEALVRKFGIEWYEQLEGAVQFQREEEE